MRPVSSSLIVLTVGVIFVGCGGSDSSSGAGGNQGVSGGGGGNVGGVRGSSELHATGGATPTAGSRTAGGPSTGGTGPSRGGSAGTPRANDKNPGGGSLATGGSKATGGSTVTGGATTSAGGSTTTGGTSSSAGGTSAGAGGDAKPSRGCGKTPTLKNSPSAANQNTLTIGGKSRQFLVRWPDNYDKNQPYRLVIGLHGATGKNTDVAPSYFGHWSLSNNSTVFVAPSADGGLWSATTDTAFVDEILKAVEDDLCIDTTRVALEGFSQGAAMAWTLACSRPGVFRAAVGYSGGGVANPASCQPIPYFGSLGLAEGNG